MLVVIIVGGVSQSIQPVSGFMIGQNDNKGFDFVVIYALRILLLVSFCIVAFFQVFPNLVLDMFGYNDADTYNNAITVLRIVSLSFILYGVNYFFMVVYQIGKYTRFSVFISVMQPVLVLPIIYLLGIIDANLLWWAFFASELILLICVVFISLCFKIKNHSLSNFFLINQNSNLNCFDVSICSTSTKDLSEYKTLLSKFFDSMNFNFCSRRVLELCCDEFVSDILSSAYKNNTKHYIDISIREVNNSALLNIKYDGNKINILENNISENLKDIELKCFSIEYKYINGQNMLFVKIDNVFNQ